MVGWSVGWLVGWLVADLAPLVVPVVAHVFVIPNVILVSSLQHSVLRAHILGLRRVWWVVGDVWDEGGVGCGVWWVGGV